MDNRTMDLINMLHSIEEEHCVTIDHKDCGEIADKLLEQSDLIYELEIENQILIKLLERLIPSPEMEEQKVIDLGTFPAYRGFEADLDRFKKTFDKKGMI